MSDSVDSTITCSVFTWAMQRNVTSENYEYGTSMYVGWMGVGMSLVFVLVELDIWLRATNRLDCVNKVYKIVV